MHITEKNLKQVRTQIRRAANACQRQPDSVLLLAVSKRKPAADIRRVFAAGQRDFGENYLQEALQKMSQLEDLDICWHFIGAIQSNKTRSIAAAFDWVHCVDRVKIAKRLGEQRPAQLAPLNVCIQLNIDDEASKAGIAISQLPELAAAIHPLPGIRLRGLMAIPAPSSTYAQQLQSFTRLAAALKSLQQLGISCDTLSMGMTQDMDAAIAAGATIVRIGTAIFGERD